MFKHRILILIVAVLIYITPQVALAQQTVGGIENFGTVVDNVFYRGAELNSETYYELANIYHIRTVISLIDNDGVEEAQWAKNAGIQFFHISMSSHEPPKPEQVAEFLRIVGNPENQPVYVHCKGGRHRTGLMVGVYRITHFQDWTLEQITAEMDAYDFRHGFGHQRLKQYVCNYYASYHKVDTTQKDTK